MVRSIVRCRIAGLMLTTETMITDMKDKDSAVLGSIH